MNKYTLLLKNLLSASLQAKKGSLISENVACSASTKNLSQ